MPLNSNLTDKEMIDLLHARLNTVEAVLSSVMPGFNTDLEQYTQLEIDKDPNLTAQQKDKLKALATQIALRHKVK